MANFLTVEDSPQLAAGSFNILRASRFSSFHFGNRHRNGRDHLVVSGCSLLVFWSGIRKIRATNSRLTLGITLGSLTGIVAIIVHSVGDFNLHIMANTILFTVLAGLLMSTGSNEAIL
ncbi:MAG: hypothetical protein KAV83_06655 [Desulfobacterales bacterium]|nr:hypothetical protein [Desulfobacterales bacterium]